MHARLQADPSSRVADVGCGSGWSSIAIALAYPKVRVEGFDIDEPSVALARENAAAEGLTERVSFSTRDAADPALSGTFDLVVAFECVHDMARPVEALRAMRPNTLRGYATDAGFSAVEVLPIAFDFWHFYRLVP